MLGRLALLFVIVPVVELILLIEIGQLVGLLPTIALVIFTGVTGAWLARAEGVRVFFQFQRELVSGRLPGQSLLDGISVLIGGAFLLTPGVLTDVVGFSLLLPFTRRWIQAGVRKRLEGRIADGTIRVVGMGSTGGFGFGAWGGAAGGPEHSEGEGPRPDVEIGRRPSAAEGRGRTGHAGAGRGRLDPTKGIDIDSDDLPR
ncbi:MAG: FxsA family protein [Gemmatimonadetes bacterium]|nr:FxsA family protein [Gemmatimonadota bacterium]NNL31437.1 FxsA family protein [Gemmatimonadota bacterium]